MVQTSPSQTNPNFVLPVHDDKAALQYHLTGRDEALPLYAESLDESFNYHHSPIVRAAYQLALNSHKGQERDVKQGMGAPFPYITHPVMLCKLLQIIENALPYEYSRKARLTGELSLAVALLHDVLEDDTQYKEAFDGNPEKLKEDLLDAIIEQVVRERMDSQGEEVDVASLKDATEVYRQNDMQMTELQYIVDTIYNDCVSLRKPQAFDKRVGQVEQLDTMSQRASAIKMLDQVASALEDVIFENRNPLKAHRFMQKALNIVKGGAENGGDVHRFIEQFFMQVYQAYQHKTPINLNEMIDHAAEGRIASLERKLERYKTHLDGHNQPINKEVLHPAIKSITPGVEEGETLAWPNYGIVGVELEKNGGEQHKVTKFSLRMPMAQKRSNQRGSVWTATSMKEHLFTAFEGSGTNKANKHLSIGVLRPIEGSMVREIWFEEPISLDEFEKGVKAAQQTFNAALEPETPQSIYPYIMKEVVRRAASPKQAREIA